MDCDDNTAERGASPNRYTHGEEPVQQSLPQQEAAPPVPRLADSGLQQRPSSPALQVRGEPVDRRGDPWGMPVGGPQQAAHLSGVKGRYAGRLQSSPADRGIRGPVRDQQSPNSPDGSSCNGPILKRHIGFLGRTATYTPCLVGFDVAHPAKHTRLLGRRPRVYW